MFSLIVRNLQERIIFGSLAKFDEKKTKTLHNSTFLLVIVTRVFSFSCYSISATQQQQQQKPNKISRPNRARHPNTKIKKLQKFKKKQRQRDNFNDKTLFYLNEDASHTKKWHTKFEKYKIKITMRWEMNCQISYNIHIVSYSISVALRVRVPLLQQASSLASTRWQLHESNLSLHEHPNDWLIHLIVSSNREDSANHLRHFVSTSSFRSTSICHHFCFLMLQLVIFRNTYMFWCPDKSTA